jgi:phytoene dehydrogenase-like protein
VVVGAGPNGLAAAITLARAGLEVEVLEAEAAPGGGARSAALTLPGFVHDPCATVMSLVTVSPFLRTVDWPGHGVAFAAPEAPVGHALAPGRSVLLERSVDGTAHGIGLDGRAWRRIFVPLMDAGEALMPWLLGPPLRPTRHPVAQARFGLPALLPLTTLARLAFRGPEARALLAGIAAHGMVPLTSLASAGPGLLLALSAHLTGWPVVSGGTGRLTEALVAELTGLGGTVTTSRRITSLDDLPPARATLLDLAPRGVLEVAGDRLPARYRRRLERFRYGPGSSKVDWALSGPIPWADPALARAGTVHLGGTLAEVTAAEAAVHRGRIADRPFVILVQATRFDPTRAPEGRHTAWAYCHVPNGSAEDAADRIEAQVERFAPGFRDLILARATRTARDIEADDPNAVGGDIGAGAMSLRQLLARPTLDLDPWSTPVRGLYLCSASTSPGGGVHGMCGQLAARSALRREFGIRA